MTQIPDWAASHGAPAEAVGGHWPGSFAGWGSEVTASPQEHFHNRVGDLVETGGMTVEEAIERAAWEVDHPAAGINIASGNCTLCERPADERVPWASELLCWECADQQLDLLALAIMDAGAVPVVLGVTA
jgi:hypothetical protein